MNIFDLVQGKIAAALSALAAEGALPAGLDMARLTVEPPRDPAHGDIATNAAMVFAKEAKTNPRALADKIAEKLRMADGINTVAIAGPGFINITLNQSVLHDCLKSAVTDGVDFGRGQASSAPAINVEYVSANPTGPMHVGHGRGAVFGDALAGLLEFAGHAVTREYYINDAGAQVDVLARSAFLRYREALGEKITIPDGLYPGDYLKPVGQALAAAHGTTLRDRPEAQWLPLVRQAAIDAMMAMIREDLAQLGVVHSIFFSERSLTVPQPGANSSAVQETIDNLRARDLVYEGRLAPPKGAPVEDWEDREQTLFRATTFGDDVDRPLLKSDGSYTYFASDIAYHRSKFTRGFPVMIDVWGADHGGYVKRMQAAVAAVTAGKGDLDVKLCQMVKLMRNGEPIKMSKRSGDFVTLREVIDEVGRDAARFMMLYRKNDAPLDFDLAKVIEQSKDNPVFYVQYAHARCHSILRQAREAFGAEPSAQESAAADLSILNDGSEIGLIKKIAQYPRLIEQAASAHEPHRVAFYLYEVASEFHAHWNRGKDAPHLRFVNQDNRKLTQSRLALVYATKAVLASGLGILGVAAPEEMR
ncbi:MAG: arginine--tRNA ligase [Beijerinckiaceae bacterium]